MINKISLIILVITLPINFALANQKFIMGNEAFKNEDYESAINYYLESLQTEKSMEQYFNLGNAYYKIDNYGRSILNYLKALTLSPSNPEVIANLAPEPPTMLRRFAKQFTVNIWTWIFVGSFWGGFGLFFLNRVYKWKWMPQNTLLLCCMTTIICSMIALYHYHRQKDTGVVIKKQAELRVAPSDSSNINDVLTEGTIVDADKTFRDYVFIQSYEPDKKEGWMKKSDFALVWE